ncbi:MAG: hypothetical protein AAFR38_08745 [Planctomycetota bacterium]
MGGLWRVIADHRGVAMVMTGCAFGVGIGEIRCALAGHGALHGAAASVGAEEPGGGPATAAGDGIEVSRQDYCRQVALATLIGLEHEIFPERVVFHRSKTRTGNAIQQFSAAFGEAIETGVNPFAGEAAARLRVATPESCSCGADNQR